MDRITGQNYILVNGVRMWQDRNLQANQEGTFGNALWFNDVQEELMSILAAAGVEPDANNMGQVLASILLLFAGQVGAFAAIGELGAYGYFYLPGPNGQKLVVNFGQFSFFDGTSPIDIVLPISFPSGYLGGLASDGGSGCYPYGVAAGADNSHIQIFKPTGTSEIGGFYIAVGK